MSKGENSRDLIDANLWLPRHNGVADRTPNRYDATRTPDDPRERLLRPVFVKDGACDAIFLFPFYSAYTANSFELWIGDTFGASDHSIDSGFGVWNWHETLFFTCSYSVTRTVNTLSIPATQTKILIELLDEFGTTIKACSVTSTISQTANNFPGAPPPFNQGSFTLDEWKFDNDEVVLPSGGVIQKWNAVRITQSVLSGSTLLAIDPASCVFIGLKMAAVINLTAGVGY